MEKLDRIPIELDFVEIEKRLRLDRQRDMDKIQALIEKVRPLLKARAVYKACYIDRKSEDAVTIDTIRLTSRVLRKNLEQVERVFPYVLTIGGELEAEVRSCKDLLEQYYVDTLGNVALTAVRKVLEDRIRSRYALEGMSFMSPGSLKDWPIEEQKPLFSILEGVEPALGVKLNESLLMIPRKSLSGIYFPTEVPFYSCQLCSRKGCPSRKARYDEKKVREYSQSHVEKKVRDEA